MHADTEQSSTARWRRYRSRSTAWVLFAFYLVFPVVVSLLLLLLWLRPGYSPSSIFLGLWISSLIFLPLTLVGTLLAAYRPENRIGWVMLLSGLLWHFSSFGDLFANNPDAFAGLPALWISWLSIWPTNLALGLVLMVLPLLFPNGDLPSPRWKPALWLIAAGLLAWMIGDAFGPEVMNQPAPEAVKIPAVVDFLEQVNPLSIALLIGAMAACVASLVVRFRRARGVERQQLKWITFVGAAIAATFILAGITATLDPGNKGGWLGSLGWYGMFFFTLAGLPVAIGVAVLRYRLYEIDRIINRALVYGALTASLLAVYLALVFGLGTLLQEIVGEDSSLVVAGSTLVVAALVRPLRSRFQSAVDRRFYRHKYDAVKTLETFGDRLRDEIDLTTLIAEVQQVVQETVQPAHVSLWLLPRERRS